jgi:hypothetical protein
MEGLRHDEIGNDEIMIKRARAALEDLKKEWGYKEKKKELVEQKC